MSPPPIPLRMLLAGFVVCLVAAPVPAAEPAPASPEGIEFFEKRIRPILVEHCNECHAHGSKQENGGLWSDSREDLLKGGDSGPALVLGDPEKSLLILAVRQTDKDLKMPPKEKPKLSETQIADLVAWVKMGAPDPRLPVAGRAQAPAKTGVSLEEGRKFWSFQPVKDPALPAVKNAAWTRTAVDHFVLAKQEAAGVSPAPPADKRTLLRRVSYDLTGLPPTPAEMQDFLADASPEAFQKVVDRLLASPRYGERWGRHWLDVVRYADTCGNASDYPVREAYKYRDWVIRAFNQDLPYDQFLKQQIAGDLLPGGTEEERRERTIATGYLAIARRFGGDRTGEHHLTIEDTIDNVGRAILGSSISCARCHDHKFDPFTISDYYGLYGIFNSTRYPFPGAEVGNQPIDFVPLMTAAEIEALLKPHREKLAAQEELVKKLEAAEAEAKKLGDNPENKPQLEAVAKALGVARQRRTQLQQETPAINSAYAVAEAMAGNVKVHLRGDPKRLGDEIPRHFPAVLGGHEVPGDPKVSGRLQLAELLADAKNPLTARVMVNRIWQHHFGKGIVQTPNDFGRRGMAPTHPELLDFLAARLVESGWSVKSVHRMILLSQTWQQASQQLSEGAKADPHNELYSRFARRRLDAESLRDSLLYVSGELVEGPQPAHPFPPTHTWRFTQHAPFFALYESRGRSVYLMQQRLRKHPYLALFDGADTSSSTAVRLPSTTPLQALYLMNGTLFHELSGKFAGRVTSAWVDEPARLAQAYQWTLNRAPLPDEAQACTQFLKQYREKLAAAKTPAEQIEGQSWMALSRVLLSSNEFLFVD